MSNERTPMTVAEFREMLAKLPDDAPIFLYDDEYATYHRPELQRADVSFSWDPRREIPAWRRADDSRPADIKGAWVL